jgi:hypothetical protein
MKREGKKKPPVGELPIQLIKGKHTSSLYISPTRRMGKKGGKS